MAKKRPNFEDLPLVPVIISDTICGRPYTGNEWSKNVVSAREVALIEAARQKMTPEEIREFGDACETRCKAAYEVKAEWFEKIINAKGDAGRDQMYYWIAHWMTSYLMTRKNFLRPLGTTPQKQKPKEKRTVAFRIGKQTIAVEVPAKKHSLSISSPVLFDDVRINGVKYVPAYLGQD